MVALALALAITVVAAPAKRAAADQTGAYNAVSPTRIASNLSIAPGGVARVQVTGVAGVPTSNVAAVSITLTGSSTATTYLSAYPDGNARPNTSNVNVLGGGATSSDAALVAPSSSGYIDVYNNLGTATVQVDVSGWYATGNSGSGYTELSPSARIANNVAIGAGQTTTVQVEGAGGMPSTGVGVVAATLTAANETASGTMVCFPDGTTRPSTSTLSTTTGSAVSVLTQCQVGSDGKIDIYNSAGTADIFVDAEGWYSSSAGTPDLFTPVIPNRILSSTLNTGTTNVTVAGVGGIPSTATTAVVDVTAAGCTATGYLEEWAAGGTQPNPATSFLNVSSGNVTDLLMAKVGTNGQITVNFSSGTTGSQHCAFDVDAVGWFGPTPGQAPAVLGDLGTQSYDTHNLSDRSSFSVNAADGNLLLQSVDMNLQAADGPGVTVTRSFNSRGTGIGMVGNRDTLSVGADVHITANGDGSATYQGPSGFQVNYPSNGSGGYNTSPDYTQATLTKVSGGGWKLTFNSSGEYYTFDTAGNLIADTDANGQATNYYLTGSTLNEALYASGEIGFNYNGTALVGLADNTNRGVSYGYTAGNLTSVTDADGKTWTYGYGGAGSPYDAGNLTSIVDPDGNTTTFTYDSLDRVLSFTQTGADGTNAGTWTYTYNSGNTAVTDADGNTTTYYYDAQGRSYTTIDGADNTRDATYDSNSNQLTGTDPDDQTQTATYDSHNNLRMVQNPNTSTGVGAADSFSYSSTGNPYLAQSSTDAQGNTTNYTYDTAGNITQSQSMSQSNTAMGMTTSTYQGDGTTNCDAKNGEVCTEVPPV